MVLLQKQKRSKYSLIMNVNNILYAEINLMNSMLKGKKCLKD